MMEVDEVILFDYVPFRRRDPAIDPVHSAFFGGLPQAEREFRFPRTGSLEVPLELTKNVYNLSAVFIANRCLIVALHIADELGRRADVELQPCIIRRAFSYPYVPGDFRFLEEGFQDGRSAEAVVAHFAERFACPAPATEYVEVITHKLTKDQEAQSAHVSLREDRDIGILDHRVVCVNLELLSKWGLYWDRCFVCSKHVFDLFEPHVAEPFFWVKRVAPRMLRVRET